MDEKDGLTRIQRRVSTLSHLLHESTRSAAEIRFERNGRVQTTTIRTGQ